VEEPPRSDPPASPAVGSCYIVAPSATGDWASYADHVAGFTTAGWRYIAPVDGMRVHVRSTGEAAIYQAGAWELGSLRGAELIIAGNKVIGERTPAIADPTGGAQIDNEARAAIVGILEALRSHGLIAT
jgi:hypothetical protein